MNGSYDHIPYYWYLCEVPVSFRGCVHYYFTCKVFYKNWHLFLSQFLKIRRARGTRRERRHLILSLADYKCYFFSRSIILREQRSSAVSNAPFSSKVFLVYHRWALRGGDFSFRFVVTPDLFNVPFLSWRD